MVPLRNEAENVEGLVATLAAQEGAFHFYLLDDNSEDQTLELLQRFTKSDSRFTVIKGAALNENGLGNLGLSSSCMKFQKRMFWCQLMPMCA